MMDDFDKKVETDKREELSKGKLKAAFKKLRIRDFAPMLYLRELFTDDKGNKKERYVTDPVQVDRVAREAWNPIYAGNIRDKILHCKNFIAKYCNASGISFCLSPTCQPKLKILTLRNSTSYSSTVKESQGDLMGGLLKISR